MTTDKLLDTFDQSATLSLDSLSNLVPLLAEHAGHIDGVAPKSAEPGLPVQESGMFEVEEIPSELSDSPGLVPQSAEEVIANADQRVFAERNLKLIFRFRAALPVGLCVATWCMLSVPLTRPQASTPAPSEASLVEITTEAPDQAATLGPASHDESLSPDVDESLVASASKAADTADVASSVDLPADGQESADGQISVEKVTLDHGSSSPTAAPIAAAELPLTTLSDTTALPTDSSTTPPASIEQLALNERETIGSPEPVLRPIATASPLPPSDSVAELDDSAGAMVCWPEDVVPANPPATDGQIGNGPQTSESVDTREGWADILRSIGTVDPDLAPDVAPISAEATPTDGSFIAQSELPPSANSDSETTSSAVCETKIVFVNPVSNGGPVRFLVGKRMMELFSGERFEISADVSDRTPVEHSRWKVKFHRGGQYGDFEAVLSAGVYLFRVSPERGWELSSHTDSAILAESAISTESDVISDPKSDAKSVEEPN